MSQIIIAGLIATKSVVRGTITITGATSNTATITSVDTTNSRLRTLGFTCNNNLDTAAQYNTVLALTNATTITASVITSPGGDSTIVSYENYESYPGAYASVQRGTATVGSPATITSVDITKTELDWLGCNSNASSAVLTLGSRIVLTNATTVTATAGIASGVQSSGYQAMERAA